jgi:glycerol-1-phosphate dehydrogenase [NAD(P)+]
MRDDDRHPYGRTLSCDCGRTHAITPVEMVYAADAVTRVPEVACRATTGRRALVLFDARTRRVAGDEVEGVLAGAGWHTASVEIPDPGPDEDPVCDDVTHAWLASQVGDADLVVPVGSGVVSDLGKWTAHAAGLPFVTVATAASMNGYTSANVAPRIAGVKSLVEAAPPHAVLARPADIAGAPYEMTASGLGDVVAKSVSSVDWRLNHRVFGDYYCPRSVELVAELEPRYLDDPEGLRARRPQAIDALFEALMLTGVAMTMAGSSAPASGGEHVISHALDMLSSVDGRAHDLHGRQVGIGTVLTCELYRRVLALEAPRTVAPPADVDRALWGPLAGEVAAQWAAKQPRFATARALVESRDGWARLRAELQPMLRPPERIRTALERAGAAYRASDIGCDHARVRTVFVHAHEIRRRFTILDLAWLVGLMPGCADEIVDQWC